VKADAPEMQAMLALVNACTLQVTITPPEAVQAGAQWRLTNEPVDLWHDSGETIRIRAGSSTLVFSTISGWTSPADQPVAVAAGEALQMVGTYGRSLFCTLSTVCENGTIKVSPAGTSFPYGTQVTLTAFPDATYWFDHWTGDVPAGLERMNPLVLTMDGDKTVQANLGSGSLPPAPVLSALAINNGLVVTLNPTVTLANICAGETSASAVQYQASESPDFTSATWQPYASVPLFTLSEGSGDKTVYFRVRNSAGVESAVTSDTITLGGAGAGIEAWGQNSDGQCDVSSPKGIFAAFAGGGFHCLAIKTDGSLEAWGYNGYKQCQVPASNSGFVAVAVGDSHSLGLKSDGSIVAWGKNFFGQCTVPSPNTGFVAIAAGTAHSLGLKSDGTLVAWGYNGHGECSLPVPNSGFVAISASSRHNLALRSDGSVVAWGDNESGQCTVPAPNSGFVAVAAGDRHSLGLKFDGSIVAWGDNQSGQCVPPSSNSGFLTIAAGWEHSLGLKSDGSIVAWGDNAQKQCEIPLPNRGFTAVSAGGLFSLALESVGSLEVKITPPPVLVAGARWRLTSEKEDVWHDETVYDPASRTTDSKLYPRIGTHTLTFKDTYGWVKPADQSVEIVANGSLSITGTYERVLWPLSTECVNGSIRVSPAGSIFPHGTTVTLTATPNYGYLFKGWRGDLTTVTNPVILTMDSTKTISAVFKQDTKVDWLALTVDVMGNGTVAKSPDQATYAYGTT
ncbi:MAG TPA: hypothetical protein PLA90_17600, partial [Candidatus Sumerlaeota bacterium]|nr:hypothetical protein [Candidatus Sumerlaeota bacterium]